jgi:hypothetical protein
LTITKIYGYDANDCKVIHSMLKTQQANWETVGLTNNKGQKKEKGNPSRKQNKYLKKQIQMTDVTKMKRMEAKRVNPKTIVHV